MSSLTEPSAAGLAVVVEPGDIWVVALREDGEILPEPVAAALETLLERRPRVILDAGALLAVDWATLGGILARLAHGRSRVAVVWPRSRVAREAGEPGPPDGVPLYATREEAAR